MTRKERKRSADTIRRDLKQRGFDALWAEGKGNGFWIKGMGYVSKPQAIKMSKTIIGNMR